MTKAPKTFTGRWGNGWVLLDGKPHQLVPYGEETEDGVDPYSTPCHVCDAEPGTRHAKGCAMGTWHRRPAECRDCGVAIGELHAMNCVVERCPACEGQYAGCDCDSSEDGPDEDD